MDLQWGLNQQWALNLDEITGAYEIANAYDDKVLDIPGFSNDDGVIVQQYTRNGGANQRWVLIQN